MHAARLNSPRLRRALKVLGDGRPHSTRDIVRKARVMAVNAVVSELRFNGAEIACDVVITGRGERRWYYTMTKGPESK